MSPLTESQIGPPSTGADPPENDAREGAVPTASRSPRSAPAPRSYKRASWSRRALAWFLDAVVTAIPVSLVITLTGIDSRQVVTVVRHRVISTHSSISLEQQIIEAVLWLGAQVVYYGLMDGSSRGQTLGKRWTGIATVDLASGEPVGFIRAGLRALITAGSLCCLLVPGLVNAFWPLFDPSLRALHDRATGTVVIEVTQ